MGYVALAVVDFERHRLAGVVQWYATQFYATEVEPVGFEPTTPCLQGRCSTN